VEKGPGAPLLLVHGFGASTFDYEERVLEPLARSHKVVAVDLYGFGWSERNDEFAYGWALWSEQLAGTLDALGIERAAIAGHSMGGAAAAVFAARHPERVESSSSPMRSIRWADGSRCISRPADSGLGS
jgi:pimeloyl-ACP methyl ester carboxylesterase